MKSKTVESVVGDAEGMHGQHHSLSPVFDTLANCDLDHLFLPMCEELGIETMNDFDDVHPADIASLRLLSKDRLSLLLCICSSEAFSKVHLCDSHREL